jgi:hypothetical protein
MATPGPGQPTGALIPCESCGQAVSDYRGTCPFCGAPTGRPEQSPTSPAPAPGAPAPARKRLFGRRDLIIVLVLLACVVAFAGCVAFANRSNKKTEALSPQARAFVDRAMPALDRVLAEAQAGDDTQAARDWNAIGEIPALTPADLTIAELYTPYANAVRSYLLGDGSVSPQQLEAARSATQAAIAKAEAD